MIVQRLYGGMINLLVLIYLANVMIIIWCDLATKHFSFGSLKHELRNVGSSWQKQRKGGCNRKETPSRRTSTIQKHCSPPRVEISQKTKRGLRGFANGYLTAGIADTGAAQNVVSLTFAQSLGLDTRPSNHKFQLGSSKQIMSLGKPSLKRLDLLEPNQLITGTVQFQWAFSEDSRHVKLEIIL
jgi:hypothetical protein